MFARPVVWWQMADLLKYIAESELEEKLLSNQQVMKTPIVRNGKQATLGYQPEVWKSWS